MGSDDYVPPPVRRLGELIAMALAAYRELERKHHIKYHVTLSATLDYALEEALDAVRDLRGYVKNLEDMVMSYELMIQDKNVDIGYLARQVRAWRRAYQELAMKYIDEIMGEAIERLIA